MKNRSFFLLPLIFLFLVAGCQFLGDPLYKARVYVKNHQGQPVGNVKVVIKERRKDIGISNATQEQKTDADGIFEFTFIGRVPEDCFIVAEKDGFKPFEKDLKLGTDKPNIVEVVLESAVN